jgi:hypothetical protein
MTQEKLDKIDFKKLADLIVKRWYATLSRDVSFSQVIEHELKALIKEDIEKK